jgi:hypothetical protein
MRKKRKKGTIPIFRACPLLVLVLKRDRDCPTSLKNGACPLLFFSRVDGRDSEEKRTVCDLRETRLSDDRGKFL